MAFNLVRPTSFEDIVPPMAPLGEKPIAATIDAAKMFGVDPDQPDEFISSFFDTCAKREAHPLVALALVPTGQAGQWQLLVYPRKGAPMAAVAQMLMQQGKMMMRRCVEANGGTSQYDPATKQFAG